MNEKVIVVNKRVGQTPLDCILEIKNKDKNLADLSITYAGRLDPLAEGVLLLLVGDECLKKEEYLKLPKVYEVEILFGFSTDTYDVLGKVEKDGTKELFDFLRSGSVSFSLVRGPKKLNNSEVSLKNILEDFTGYFEQKYPPYSSRTVLGKPLFKWAREGKLSEIEIPTHKVHIEKIEIMGEFSYSGLELLDKIKKDISLVSGDFRQEEILKIWEEKLKKQNENIFHSVSVRVSSGGGVYMRSLANDIGEKIGIPALALRIKRVSVGDFKL